MTHVVLVHGIAQEQQAADTLEAAWLPALAGGVRTAGYPGLADRLWRSAHPGDITCRMAYYGDLFRTPGAQGDSLSDPTPDDALAEQIATAWLWAAADHGSARDQVAARQGLATLADDQSGAQGPRAAVRPAMNALARVPWFAPFGLSTAGRFVKRTLDQVTRYLTDDAVRAQVIDRVLTLIGEDTRLVIGHSLGSVVAQEALFHTDQPVHLITHAKVRDGAVANRPFYTAIGVDLQGHRDVLGVWAGTPGAGESSKFWISILTELKNRGVQDIFYLICDGLKGMPESVNTVFTSTWPCGPLTRKAPDNNAGSHAGSQS